MMGIMTTVLPGLTPLLRFMQMAPGVKDRLFRNVQNLLAVYRNPDQGIAVPLRFPVNAEKPQRSGQHHHSNPVP